MGNMEKGHTYINNLNNGVTIVNKVIDVDEENTVYTDRTIFLPVPVKKIEITSRLKLDD